MSNDILKAVRLGRLKLSQDEFARRLRDAGTAAGEPNSASKRLVARWEAGESNPRPVYARALERVTGMPIEALGFPKIGSGTGGGRTMSAAETDAEGVTQAPSTAASEPAVADFSGIWVSRYEFYSSSRDQPFTGAHHVVLLQTGDRITGQSISPNSLDPGSSLSLDLTVDRNVVKGTWRERTGPEGYYTGATFHGALQLVAEPTGRRMAGKWVGFGKDLDVNTGPWELRFLNAFTAPSTIERYSETPE